MIIYIALLWWPTIVFSNKIRFQPAVFVQEWIKAVCSISIIFLVLEYQKYSIEINRRKTYCRETLERKIVDPIQNLIHTSQDWSDPSQAEMDKFISDWASFYKTLTDIDMFSFNISFKNKKILEFKKEFNLSHLNKKIIGYMNTPKSNDIPITINELKEIANTFSQEINQIN